MHDVDRTQLEYPSEFSEYGEIPEFTSEQYEYSGEAGSVLGSLFSQAEAEGAFEVGGYQEYQELPLPEATEQELASQFLEVRDEQELDHFLGKVFNNVVGAVRKFAKSPVGQALGGVLKQVAKQGLQQLGQMAGQYLGGPAGGAVGGQLASTLGQAFGLELEGLSPEDRDFEVARRYVRFAGDAARRAATAPPQLDPVSVAKAAVTDAAKNFAPGLLAPPRPAPPLGAVAPPRPAPPLGAVAPPRPAPPRPAPPRPAPPGVTPLRYRCEGKWIRRGRHIVLLGV
jgi:hypothetical protein